MRWPTSPAACRDGLLSLIHIFSNEITISTKDNRDMRDNHHVLNDLCLSLIHISNLLDQAIDAAAQQQNDRRMIDLHVCRRQGFAVINVIGPALSGSQSDHGRRHSYELKVARCV